MANSISKLDPNGVDQKSLVTVVTDLCIAIRALKSGQDLTSACIDGLTDAMDADAGITGTSFNSDFGIGGSSASAPSVTSFSLPTSAEDSDARTCTPAR